MYKSIYVPVDNSEYSNRAAKAAMSLGHTFSAKVTGCHVYAAKMHDYRFKQMEFTLPEEYLQEQELERQRKIHDSLITMGLELISDSYLDQVDKDCKGIGVEFRRKMMDGKHHVEILKDIQASDYDLVMIGALGIGKMRDSQIGSVCERVTRTCDRDVWVVKHIPRDDEPERDTILVGVDGSPQSFGALMTSCELAKRFNKKVEMIGVYDPYLHYAVFNGIVSVLSEKASKVFRFEEQNQLHEEIIDTGLAAIYQSHLNVGEKMARDAGVEISKTLLDGKAFQKILDHIRKIKPWLLVIGRIGVHSEKDEKALGSNTENLLRLAPCDVLLTTRLEQPQIDLKAEETILWTPEAEGRMTRVPEQVRGIARTAILRLALEKGHSVVTNSVIDEAMDRFMPKQARQATEKLAESLAFEAARTREVSMCKKCGVTSRIEKPVVCTVCGHREFQVVTPEMIDKIASSQGGVEEETTYDGRKLQWATDARKALGIIKDKYTLRRTKAKIEKSARMKKMAIVTVDFASAIIREETGETVPVMTEEQALKPHNFSDGLKVVGRDSKGNELKSVFDWSEDAVARILRVPAGFMRNKVQERVEHIALDRKVVSVDLALVEEGIELGRQMMTEMLRTAGITDQKQEEAGSQKLETRNNPASGLQPPASEMVSNQTVSHVHEGVVEPVLNESGLMSALAEKREQLK